MGGPDANSYVRVDTHRAAPLVETVDIPGGLMFVDVAGSHAGGWHGAVAAQLRSVDEFVLAGCRCVLIRSPEAIGADVEQGAEIIQALIAQRGGSSPPVGVLQFDFGEPGPHMWWSEVDSSRRDGQLLALARSVELAALLQAGKAHWRPTTFHYELPSDEHRSDFIRVGDVFRSPRDAAALATWLYPYADTDQTILLDSSTILPVVLALQTTAAEHNVKLGPVAVRDAYPNSLLADEELVELTVGANGAFASTLTCYSGTRASWQRSKSSWITARMTRTMAGPTSTNWQALTRSWRWTKTQRARVSTGSPTGLASVSPKSPHRWSRSHRDQPTMSGSDWLQRRQTWQGQSGAPNPAAVLLCGSPERSNDQLPRLLPNSLFGNRMSMVGTLVGVGAALHRRRLELEAQGGPPGLRFDLSRIPAVYFEVPILSAVLRWIRPHEAFWEYRGLPVQDVLRDLWEKTNFEEPGSRETLLAELAVAAAAGKIPRRAKDTIEDFFRQVAEGGDVFDEAPLETARQLMEAAWGPPNAPDD